MEIARKGLAMISSEVQRTLVKSPPELWAELSDPESLARHLGALGEIRITRAEPEKLVEWEAEKTSGVVQIKSSGWGTKVTLSVTRELEAPVASEAADTSAQEPDATVQAIAVPDPVEIELSTEVAETTVTEEPLAASDASAIEVPTAFEATASADNVTMVEQERLSAVTESVLEDEPTASIEDHLGELDQSSTVADLPADAEAVTLPPNLEAPSDLTPRRGFFARLFGRRRSKVDPRSSEEVPEELLPQEEEIHGEVHEEATDKETVTEKPRAPRASAIESLQERFATPARRTSTEEPVTPELTATPSSDPPAAAEPPSAAPLSTAEPSSAVPHSPEPTAELRSTPPATHQPSAEPIAHPVATPEPAAEPSSPAQAETQTSADTEMSTARTAADIAAELAAAEEIAAEEVTAVLTAALDRLGAAHHRPFSRA